MYIGGVEANPACLFSLCFSLLLLLHMRVFPFPCLLSFEVMQLSDVSIPLDESRHRWIGIRWR